MWLEPDEFGDVVFLREAGEDFCLVLADADREVAGDAEVEDAGLAGHEVDVEGALHWVDCDSRGRRIPTTIERKEKRKRDFSLREPTHSQERMRKKKRRLAPFEMTVLGGGDGEKMACFVRKNGGGMSASW